MPKILELEYAGELGAANYILGVRDGEAVRFAVDLFTADSEPVINSSFTVLTDTPADYVDQAGKLAAVNSTETALEFVDPPSSLPAGGAAGQVLTKNSATDGDAGWGDAVSTFLGLSDTPDSYSAYPGKVVAVKADSSGLEFVSASAGSYTIVDLTSATEDYALAPGEVAKIAYSSATSVPLHIATSEGIYELFMFGNATAAVHDGWVSLRPNTSGISTFYSDLSGQQNGGTPYGSVSTGASIIAQDGALISTKGIVFTYTASKSAEFSGLGRRTSYRQRRSLFTYCTDVTTPWVSLGTILLGAAQSGVVVVRRII